MACNYPVRAYRVASGEVRFFVVRGDDVIEDLMVPCGKCLGCKLDRTREWASRCVHEAKLYEDNCFVTLTYDDKNLPDEGTLVYRDFQLFMKRLRKRYPGKKIRFYMCGEYGENNGRPHYHACLFNHNFEDREILKTTKAGDRLYTSKILSELWGKGLCSIGDVSYKSAQYVASYIMKKAVQPGDRKLEHYDLETGEVTWKEPEFTRMSLKPGIGLGFLEKFKSDMYPHDICVINGLELRPPKYYARKIAEQDPQAWEEISYRRFLKGKQYQHDRTDDRLKVKEECIRAKMNFRKKDVKL